MTYACKKAWKHSRAKILNLPNVASATEMAATGNNLNKTDIKLLEKVEELTLYLLEMKKANEVQNAEIQNLKKQVKSLRKK